MANRTGVERIAAERERQLQQWTPAHDRECHNDDTLHDAAITVLGGIDIGPDWARRLKFKHADDKVNRLTIAGALIAAELDRIYEVEPPKSDTPSVQQLVAKAKRAIQNELPEDEPDTIPDWCYETIIRSVLECQR